ncbi:hypothetical protein Ahy_B03g063336 [Arachis hypogaea]|uniref:Costars domain-containing protein n=1 Tax=Arachis hypogaea TaxID=3818 RepID=A0A444ZWX2_ARAHY|nr:hypothetical protein Ahy_B03g063336 [Arachis hypogaea]
MMIESKGLGFPRERNGGCCRRKFLAHEKKRFNASEKRSRGSVRSKQMFHVIYPNALHNLNDHSMACIMKVTFGTLFNDDQCANIFEALVGTLRAAKKRKVVSYDGELLLQGVHDNVEITLNPTP